MFGQGNPESEEVRRLYERIGRQSVSGQPGEGWVCPKCGRVYSPTWFECQPCNKR